MEPTIQDALLFVATFMPLYANFWQYVEGRRNFMQWSLPYNTTLVRSVAQFSSTERCNSSSSGWNALFCMRRFQCALSDIVSSIFSISVDTLVSRYVSSGISDAQRRETELLTDGRHSTLFLIDNYLLGIKYYVCRLFFCQSDSATLLEHVCISYDAQLVFCFIFLSW